MEIGPSTASYRMCGGPAHRRARYRLQFVNNSVDDHPVHLHRHSFELRRSGRERQSGHHQDVVLVDARTRMEVEFTATIGRSLFHCHQQNHMDRGFMMVSTMPERPTTPSCRGFVVLLAFAAAPLSSGLNQL